MSKALAAAERVKIIDPSINVTPVCEYLTEANAPALLDGADIVIDCLDRIESRLRLEGAAADAGIHMVHGAISGWDLQAMLVPPGSGLLHTLYEGTPESDVKTSLPMTPAACAAIEVSLAVRYLCGHDVPAPGTLYAGSLRDMQYGAIALTTGDE
jgi:molybdopterin/thiamine biosynthesis adenylyltransferase